MQNERAVSNSFLLPIDIHRVNNMEAPSLQELETFKYSELQKLAKVAGFKANLKADRLLKALKKHFHPDIGTEQSSDDSDGNCTVTDKDELQSRPEVEPQISFDHVTHRRGRGKKNVQNETSQEESSLNNLKTDNENQVPEKEHVQETGDEKHTEDTTRIGSAGQQRKRQRHEDEIPDNTLETATKRQNNATAQPGGKIPRYIGRLSKSAPKLSTPNFKKLHEAHFKKMESIDVYMDRKQKRLDAVSNTIQEVKKSLHSKFSPRSPAPRKSTLPPTKTPSSQQRSTTSNKSILVAKSGFKPTVFLSSKMNVRFSEATKDNEHKGSLLKTPARRSSPSVPSSTGSQSGRHLVLSNKSTSEPNVALNESVTTPFKFNAPAVTTPSSNKKLKFDLQASLTRPLGYQPHKGKLKPWGEAKENQAGFKNNNVSTLKNTYKQPPLSSRDDRRKQHEKDRKCKRDKTVGTRRGIRALE